MGENNKIHAASVRGISFSFLKKSDNTGLMRRKMGIRWSMEMVSLGGGEGLYVQWHSGSVIVLPLCSANAPKSVLPLIRSWALASRLCVWFALLRGLPLASFSCCENCSKVTQLNFMRIKGKNLSRISMLKLKYNSKWLEENTLWYSLNVIFWIYFR